MMDIPATVRPLFIAAGWRPDRRVTVPSEVPVDHPAAAILSEFGDLIVGTNGVGQECSSSDVAFGRSWSVPTLVEPWSKLLGSSLVSVAETDTGHCELYVDGLRRYFGISMIHDAFWFVGQSFGEAMERLLLGRRPQPMLRPGQDSVMLYGETFTADHPSIYRY